MSRVNWFSDLEDNVDGTILSVVDFVFSVSKTIPYTEHTYARAVKKESMKYFYMNTRGKRDTDRSHWLPTTAT
jgi:hypothetical protein